MRFSFVLLCVWNVVFDINQLICIHNLLGVESETLLKQEREKETSCGWLKNKSDRMTCRERWWWSNSWLGAFFFFQILFSAFRAEFPDRREQFFFSFYYRRNSWVVSTFFFCSLLTADPFCFFVHLRRESVTIPALGLLYLEQVQQPRQLAKKI